jgi:type I restriction enzyme, S subunit
MNSWTEGTVGELFELDPGYAFKSSDFIDAGIPVIKIKNIKAGYFSEHEFSYVDPRFLTTRSDTLARPGDLLISMSGNRHDGSPDTWVGKIAPFRKTESYFINQRVGALRLKPGAEVDLRYAGFLLSSPPFQEFFISIATSSGGQANLSPQQILSAPISYPSIDVQISIGELLGALSDKIELNRRLNATLMKMAQAIFRDWFVDFGPVHAKAEGRLPYLAPELWALFPDRIGEGGRPAGWSIDTLAALAELNPESWTDRNHPQEVEYVDLANTKWGFIESTECHLWAEAPSRARRVIRPGDTIVGTVRPGNGSFAYVDQDGLTASTGFAVLRPRSDSRRGFVYCAATSRQNIDRLTHLADGAAYPAVRPDIVANTEVIVPSLSILDAFEEMTGPLISQAEATKRENKTLEALRDLLLPKLMTGEIRLRDLDRATQASL